jgi:hypothetical protein
MTPLTNHGPVASELARAWHARALAAPGGQTDLRQR